MIITDLFFEDIDGRVSLHLELAIRGKTAYCLEYIGIFDGIF